MLSFTEARKVVRNLKLESVDAWWKYCKSGKKPNNIPNSPQGKYPKEWITYSDWLGLKRKKTSKGRHYNDAREYARSLGFSNKKQWTEFKQSDKLPRDIPKNPEVTYRYKGWVDWEDWLNFQKKKPFLSFDDARKLLIKIGINSSSKFKQMNDSGKRPDNIPSSPMSSYKNEWKGWPNFFGTKKLGVTGTKKDFLPFNDARKFVITLDLKGNKEWREYSSSGKRPDNIPANPESRYIDEWGGYAYWVGTSNTPIKRKDKYL